MSTWSTCCGFVAAACRTPCRRPTSSRATRTSISSCSISRLRRIPAHSWYRLQRAVEQTHLAFLILTPVALVPSAQLRLELVRAHDLSAQNQPRPHLADALQVIPQRQRLAASA
jgi:sensor c-di-GMP phosphodiesterase-like protein